MGRKKRSQFMVEPAVQRAFLVRAAIYWLASVLCVTLLVDCWSTLCERAGLLNVRFGLLSGSPLALPITGSLLLMPLVVWDMLRLSNRLVGPLQRLRASMQRLTAGEPVTLIQFRDGDFWKGYADDYNSLVLLVEDLRKRLAAAEQKEHAAC